MHTVGVLPYFEVLNTDEINNSSKDENTRITVSDTYVSGSKMRRKHTKKVVRKCKYVVKSFTKN
jgi:hypothetical protein